MTKFHNDDYIRFLRLVRPHDGDNASECNVRMQRYHIGEDCSVFDGTLTSKLQRFA